MAERTYKIYQAAPAGSAGATYVQAVQSCTIRGIMLGGYVQGAAANDSCYLIELSKNPNYALTTHDAPDILAAMTVLVEFDTAVGRTTYDLTRWLGPLSLPWGMGERIYLNTAYSLTQPAAALVTAVIYVG